uniref:Uncharacterized protein n=1 Tax=Rhizophora mucronata TaxID=61149 RepID=A0A2P2Q1T5_RHIMU
MAGAIKSFGKPYSSTNEFDINNCMANINTSIGFRSSKIYL